MGTYRSSEYPRWTASSSARSCGGGGAFDHACQKRHSITHGSSQLLTRRRATGHDGGRFSCCSSSESSSFFPRLLCNGLGLWCRIHEHRRLLSGVRPPAETEGAQYQLPVPSDGMVAPDLEVGEAQLSLDLPVALLHPLPQAVESYHLRQISFLKRRFFCLAVARGGQVGQQIPRTVGWQ